jgi:hypothetical protein
LGIDACRGGRERIVTRMGEDRFRASSPWRIELYAEGGSPNSSHMESITGLNRSRETDS